MHRAEPIGGDRIAKALTTSEKPATTVNWPPFRPFLLCAMVVVRRLSSTGENAGEHATAADRQAS
jgi:hypothetical protein